MNSLLEVSLREQSSDGNVPCMLHMKLQGTDFKSSLLVIYIYMCVCVCVSEINIR